MYVCILLPHSISWAICYSIPFKIPASSHGREKPVPSRGGPPCLLFVEPRARIHRWQAPESETRHTNMHEFGIGGWGGPIMHKEIIPPYHYPNLLKTHPNSNQCIKQHCQFPPASSTLENKNPKMSSTRREKWHVEIKGESKLIQF